MTKGMLATPPLTHEAALALPLKVAAAATGAVGADDVPEPTGKSMALLELLATSNLDGAAPAVLARVDELIGQGASPTEAQALHCAAANDAHQLFQPLISRGADVNGRGKKGCTPLMVAAEMAMGRTNPIHNPEPSAQAVSALIALGADKNLTDTRGRTALGYHYASVRNNNDFKAALSGGGKTKGGHDAPSDAHAEQRVDRRGQGVPRRQGEERLHAVDGRCGDGNGSDQPHPQPRAKRASRLRADRPRGRQEPH